MRYTYKPQGVCSMQMIFEIDGDIVKDIRIVGGCPGNTVGVATLAKGKRINEIIEMLKGIPCGSKGTSCPDQIAKALEEFRKKYEN